MTKTFADGFTDGARKIIAMLDGVASRGLSGGEQPIRGFPQMRSLHYRLTDAERVHLRNFCRDFIADVRRSGCGLIGTSEGHPGDLVRHVQALEEYAFPDAAPEAKAENPNGN